MNGKDLLAKFAKFLAAEPDGEAPLVELAEGVEAEVECGRPGKFTDMHKQTAEFTPESLSELAGTLDPEEALVKIGHTAIATDTPHYGTVKALRYDAARERLLATIVPTPALVRKNREEGFKRVSMELAGKSLSGPWRFLNLAFLAARKPGVTGLAPLALAAGEAEFVFAGADDAEAFDFVGKLPLDTRAKVNVEATDEQETRKMEAQIAADLAAANAETARHKADADRLRGQLKDGARVQVQAFLAANVKRIPMTLRRAGLEDGLVAMLASEVEREPVTLEFSAFESDGKTPKAIRQSPAAFVFAMLAALPEQVTATETVETTKKGGAEDAVVDMADFPEDVDRESVEQDKAVRLEMAAAKEAGQEIGYLEGVQLVERKKRGRARA